MSEPCRFHQVNSIGVCRVCAQREAEAKPNAAHPVTADRFARYEAALREIATIKPSAAGAIAEIALKDDGVIL